MLVTVMVTKESEFCEQTVLNLSAWIQTKFILFYWETSEYHLLLPCLSFLDCFFASFRRLYFVNRNIFLTTYFTGQSIFLLVVYFFLTFSKYDPISSGYYFLRNIFISCSNLNLSLDDNKTLVSQEIRMAILYTESVKGHSQQHTPILISEPSHLTIHLSRILKSNYY